MAMGIGNDVNVNLFRSVGLSSNNATSSVVKKGTDGSIFTTFMDQNGKAVATKYEDGNNIGFCRETGSKDDPNRCVNLSANTVRNGMLTETPDDKSRLNNFISTQLPQAPEGTWINSNTTVKNMMLTDDTVKSIDYNRSNSPFPADIQASANQMFNYGN